MAAGSFRLLDPATLTPSPYNGKTEGDLTGLRDEIERRGVLRPALVTSEGRVVGGWHRRLVCEEIGIALPAWVVPRMSPSDERVALTADNMTDRFEDRPEFTVVLDEELDSDGWHTGTVSGTVASVSKNDRLTIRYVQRLAARGCPGSIVVNEEHRVIDGFAAAAYSALTGEPVIVRVASGGRIETANVADWDLTPHPSNGRFGVQPNYRRVSPLWRMVLSEGAPGRVLDMGCGWGWHLSQLPENWRAIGYEPYRRKRNTSSIDKPWVRSAIRRVADDVAEHGKFDHVVLDHVLFLTGSTEAGLTAIDAAMTLLKPEGSLWVSSYWHVLQSIAGKVEDNLHVGGYGDRRYLVRTWPRAELTAVLEERFQTVKSVHHGESHLYRCDGPLHERLDAVKAEFDLEWDDGTTPGVVDELMEVLR